MHTIDLQGSHGSLVGMGPTGLLRFRDGQQEGCNCEHLVLWGQNKADMEAYLREHFRGVPKYSWMPATTDPQPGTRADMGLLIWVTSIVFHFFCIGQWRSLSRPSFSFEPHKIVRQLASRDRDSF